jgi:uncharacterized membrane protein
MKGDQRMSDLVVFTYQEEDKAGEVLQALAKMQQEHLVDIEDAAVVVKNQKGKVKVRQTLETAVTAGSASRGGFWGLLIGFLFGGPLFGALLGMAVGALMGRGVDIGVDNQFIKDVGDDLVPGDSAIFVLIRKMTPDKVTAQLKRFGGTLYHTSLSAEAEAALVRALEDETVAKAVEAEAA